jgi:hypothetical protein
MQDELLAESIREIREGVSRVESKVDRLFNGPEGEPHKGVMVRLDRLEQTTRNIGRFVWAVATAVIGLVVTKIASILNALPPGGKP